MTPPRTSVPFAAALALALTSGAAALGHELLWTRRLLDVTGSSAASGTRVFGAFFLGLSLGALVIARHSVFTRRPWLWLALAELAIAALSAPLLFLPEFTDWIWPWLGRAPLTGAAGGAIKLLVSIVFVCPPAVMMGTTLPLLAAAAVDAQPNMARHGIWLYGANTAGGVLGLILVLLVLMPVLGVRGAMTMILLNAIVAGVAFGFARSRPRAAAARPLPRGDVAEGTRPPRWVIALAAFSGFGILAAEVIALRLLMLLATTSLHAPFGVLVAVILALAAAAFATPLVRTSLSLQAVTAFALVAAGLCFALAPFLFVQVAAHPDWLSAAGAGAFVARLALLTLAVIGPGVLFAGTVFPNLFRLARGRNGHASALAWLLAANGLGGLIGAEVAYRGLLPWLGPHVALGAVGLLYVVAGALMAALAKSMRHVFLAAPVLAGVVALVFVPLRNLPIVNPHMNFAIIAQESGREGTLVVADHPQMGRLMLVDNQYVLGSTSARHDQERQAHLALLLHPLPRRVAFIGVATGMTPGAALMHPEVQAIEAIELSEVVTRMARQHFGDVNHHVLDHEKVTVAVEDGRSYLAAAQDAFDVVAGDLFLPWGAGAGSLYSLEHFRAVKRALREGGLFCQWLPAYQLTSDQLTLIINTFLQVFPEAELFRGGFHPDRPTLALIGLKGPGLDWNVVRQRADALRARDDVKDPSVRSQEALALLHLGPAAPLVQPATPVNTLANMLFERDASKVRLSGGGQGLYLYNRNWTTFLEGRYRHLGSGAAELTRSEAVRRWARLGIMLTNWEIARRTGHASAPDLQRQIAQAFPRSVAADHGADWSHWPGLGRWQLER
ncbi:MAG: fused MFS/spermidine synthase [Myxococcales bacterium]|nr:fused MFS/spermidine synthase [Myxococcales bacterium]